MKNKNHRLVATLLLLTAFTLACALLPPPPVREPDQQQPVEQSKFIRAYRDRPGEIAFTYAIP